MYAFIHSLGTSHPTIKSPEQGLDVLARFASEFSPPMSHEGYQRCLHLTPDQTLLNYSQADIETILESVRNSVPVQPPEVASLHSRSAPRGSRPYSYRGGRGAGGPGGGYRRGIRGGYIRSQRGVEAFAHDRDELNASKSSAILHGQTGVVEPAGQATQEDRREAEEGGGTS